MTAPAAQTPLVLMYSTAWCPYCMRARSLLERNGVEYLDIPVDEEPEMREQMVARSGGLRTVPQIFIGERHVGGFDELHALERAGELERMLGTK